MSASAGQGISPFNITVSDADLADLKHRLARTRWPDRETVTDWSQGVPLATVRGLCDHWAQGYDWRATERRLNRLHHYTTRIDGVEIHAVHARSPRPDPIPVLLTHGWPGSFLEFEQVIEPLTNPPDDDDPAFDVVIPSLPGYGFSGKTTEPGWDIHRIARAWCELATRLGYYRFIAAGSDWGTSISTSIALQHPERLLGLHLVPPLVPPDRHATDLTESERTALADLDERTRTGSGYSAVHGTRPQTLGYGLSDSPAGLAAWIGEKLWRWTDPSTSGLTSDQILDNPGSLRSRGVRRCVLEERDRLAWFDRFCRVLLVENGVKGHGSW
jgi:pimeloyl-ACP methyl ester carboxylesterase